MTTEELPEEELPEFDVAGYYGEDGAALSLTFPADISPVGIYANGALVWANPSDLVIDFFVGPMAPTDPQVTVVARLRLPPATAEQFGTYLAKQVTRARELYGGPKE